MIEPTWSREGLGGFKRSPQIETNAATAFFGPPAIAVVGSAAYMAIFAPEALENIWHAVTNDSSTGAGYWDGQDRENARVEGYCNGMNHVGPFTEEHYPGYLGDPDRRVLRCEACGGTVSGSFETYN